MSRQIADVHQLFARLAIDRGVSSATFSTMIDVCSTVLSRVQLMNSPINEWLNEWMHALTYLFSGSSWLELNYKHKTTHAINKKVTGIYVMCIK